MCIQQQNQRQQGKQQQTIITTTTNITITTITTTRIKTTNNNHEILPSSLCPSIPYPYDTFTYLLYVCVIQAFTPQLSNSHRIHTTNVPTHYFVLYIFVISDETPHNTSLKQIDIVWRCNICLLTAYCIT